jgi:MFS family permease
VTAERTPRRGSLWRHRDFLKLWGGESVSKLGSQVTALAIPLIAITVLKATTFEVGLLSAVEFAPFILVALHAGVWVDRLRKRPVLITADAGRLAALASIPIAYELGVLTIGQLYVVAFMTGVLTVFFDVAYQSYLPLLVDRDQLTDGNGKLATSESFAQVAGPSLAGGLIELMGSPLAILADAASFAVSGVALLGIRKQELPRAAASEEPRLGMRKEIAEGLGYVLRHPLLRPQALCTGTSNLFSLMGYSVITLYMVRKLGMSAGAIGLVMSVGSVGVLLGALLSTRITRRIGFGRAVVAAIASGGLGSVFFPLAHGATPEPWLVAGFFVASFGQPIYNINQVSLRQAITPARLQGRMNASMRFMVWGTMPVGSLLGGLLGTLIGLRATLWVAAIGGSLAFLWVLLSPVRSLRTIPEPVDVDPGSERAAGRGERFNDSDGEEVVHPAPGVSGVSGAMSGPGGVVDETVLGLGIPGGGDVR